MKNSFYVHFPKHVKYMTGEEIQLYLPGEYTNALLMRSIIMNEKQHYITTSDTRTLRGVWYSTVKPTLDKLGLLQDNDMTEEGLTKWDATLSKYMGQLLRKGYLTYRDLGIVDTSRRRDNPREMYNTTDISAYGYKVNIAPYSNIIIATEKDTVYNIISSIARLLGCSCLSCKGQNALGAMEGLIRNIKYNKGYVDKIIILTMTDYDPAGYYIADALQKQAKDLCNALGMHGVKVEYKRIGITPNQLSKEMVHMNKYTPKPANLDKWFEKTGGIFGEKKGLELDALTSDEIRSIFVKEIKRYVDKYLYKSYLKKSYLSYITLKHSEEYMKKIIKYITHHLEDKVKIKSDIDVFDLAIQGMSSIPVYNVCRRNVENSLNKQAEKLIKQVFNNEILEEYE